MTGGTSNRECSYNYRRVIADFGRYRLIDGSCGITWVIQRRDGHSKDGTPRWTGRSYPRSREKVIYLCRSFCGDIAPEVMALLEQLPDRHPCWGRKK